MVTLGGELTKYLQINTTFIGFRSFVKTKTDRQRPIKDTEKV